jgi:hypothetical protein
MQERKGFAAMALLVGAFGARGCSCDEGVSALSGLLAAAPQRLDFGRVVVTTRRDLGVELVNAGTAAVPYDLKVDGDAAFVAVPVGPGELPPGGRLTVTVTFAPAAVGPAAATLRLAADLAVPLAGEGVEPALVVEPDPVDFGEVDVLTTAIQAVQVTNRGTSGVSVTAVGLTGAGAARFANTSVLELPVALPARDPPEVLTLVLSFRPMALGEVAASLRLATDAPGQAEVVVAVRGTGVAPAVRIEPDAVDFGVVAADGRATRRVTIHNDGVRPLAMQPPDVPATSDGSEFSLFSPVFPLTVEAGAATAVELAYAPADRRPDDVRVTWGTNDPLRPEASLHLTGRAPRPDILVGDLLLNPVGAGATTQDGDVLIRNAGDDPLSVLRVDLVAGQPADDCAPFSLPARPAVPRVVPPDGETTVTVRFTPPAAGLYACGLLVESDDPDRPTVVARIVGRKD